MFAEFETVDPEELRRRTEAEISPQTVFGLLARTVERHGDAIGLNFFDDGAALSWREIARATERAANALRAAGVVKGSHVGVLLPNVIEYPIIWLGLARLGAVMAPINIGYTPRELRYIVEDSQAEFLVLHSDLRASYDALDPKPVPFSRAIVVGERLADFPLHWNALFAEAADSFRPAWPVEPDDVLNIQYTSGTTGFPKGCMLSQRYWVTIGQACASVFGARMERVYGGFNFFYMIVQRMLMHAMIQGSALYVPRKPAIRRVMADIRAHRLDNTSVFESSVYKHPPHPDDGKNALKLVNTFGLTKEYHEDFQRRFDVPAQEIYGMTEIGAALYMPIHEVAAMTGKGSCGVCAPFVRLMIADEQGRPVKDGEAGELCVKGPAILHGYYNKNEANEAAFRDGWFRTGDQFRRDERGFHTIVGRFKDMVRRAGENIAAREVEAVLRALPEIQDAAVLPVPDDYRGEEIKAYLMLMPGLTRADFPPARVFAHCAGHLAPFKVPRYLEYRDALPRTESGRVRKKTLAAEKPDLRADSFDRQDSVWR